MLEKVYQCIFFGEDKFSLEVLRSVIDSEEYKFNIGLVVILAKKGRVNTGLIAFCEQSSIRYRLVESMSDKYLIEELKQIEYDFLLSAHFSRLIPMKVVEGARLAALNLHPSLLPKYRGMSPQHWPIIFGDSNTGVTVHYMDKDADTGKIVSQTLVPIDSNAYIYQLQLAFVPIYREIMIASMKKVISGFKGEVQVSEGSSYYHMITEADMDLERQVSVIDAYRRIRAFSFPYAGAFFRDYKIMEAHIINVDEIKELTKGGKDPHLEIVDGNMVLNYPDGSLCVTRWKKI